MATTFTPRNNRSLVYFGNENLQKGIFDVSFDGSKSASPQEAQSLPLARAEGASVVNTRIASKIITLTGALNTKQASGISKYNGDIQTLIKDFDAIFDVDDWQYVRLVPEYGEVIPTSATDNWSASDDAVNLEAYSSKWQNPDLNTSLGFDIDVSNSANDYSTLTYSAASGYDMSNYKNQGNFEFALHIPDAYYVSSVEFYIGSDSGNYYSNEFLNDYQGRTIHNGINLFSIKWDDLVETGTVDASDIKWCKVVINYSSSAIDMDDCYLDNIFWVNEDRARAFKCYRQGEIQRGGEHWKTTYTQWQMNFLNYTGYANSIHYYDLFSQENVTGVSDTQLTSFDGSLAPLPRFELDIATASQIDIFSIANLNNNQEIDLIATALADGDQVIFGDLEKVTEQNGEPMDFNGVIPRFGLGKHRTRLSLSGSNAYTIPSTAITRTSDRSNSGNKVDVEAEGVRQIAQSFTTVGAGLLTSFNMEGYYMVNPQPIGTPPFSYSLPWRIETDNAGDPSGSVLDSGNLTIDQGSAYRNTFEESGLSISLNAATKYWLIFDCYYCLGFIISQYYWGELFWSYNSSNDAYTGGEAKYTIDSGSSWSAYTGDQVFSVDIEPQGSWRVDWLAKYKKRYLA